ncbi:transcription elongation factor GreA [Bacteroidia bacterium]|nr:transcription elongation factor GreA [Bacteroidia bacterium]
MAKVKYYSQEGLDKLREEMRILVEDELPKAAKAISEARDKGDLSENAEYAAAKETQAFLAMKVNEMQETLSNARLLDVSKLDVTKVLIYSTVKIKNLINGVEMTYTLVPSSEADVNSGKLSVESPISKGLLGHKVGDKVDITVPAGVLKFEILENSR